MAGLLDNFKSMSQGRLLAMIAAAVGLLGFFIFISLRVSSPALAPLYSNLTLQDSSKIVSELEKQGVPYELRSNGAEVLVPQDRMLRLRMSMAEIGLPSGGSIVGYEIFDKTDTLGSSNAVININMLRALEGELGRTISSFTQVESARVHLVIPKREMFAKDKSEPSASVALKLRGASELTKQEVQAITHLVAAAVSGLKPSKITVVDSYGRLLARGDGDDTIDVAITAAEEHRTGFERRMKETLEGLVEKIVGPGKVKVQVMADMNFDRVVTNTEKFDPEGQVIRSTQSTNENEKSQDREGGQSVTAANNLPGAAASGGAGGNSNRDNQKADETTNYEISKTTQNLISGGGKLNKMSVAVLVDGNYAKDSNDNETYAPRDEKELKQIESLIKSAIGFDEKRGDTVEVVNMRFSSVGTSKEFETSFFDRIKQMLQGIIQTLIIAGVAVLAILSVLKPAILHLIKTITPPSERIANEMAALSGPGGAAFRLPPGANPATYAAMGGGGGNMSGGGGGDDDEESLIDLDNISGRVKSSSVRKINEFIDKHPEEAINVVRQWIFKESF